MNINFQAFGPGKFSNNVEETLYTLSLDGGADDETGDSTWDWYGTLDLSDDPLIVAYSDGRTETIAYVLLYESSTGFVSYESFETAEEMQAEFDLYAADYAEDSDPFGFS